jgi:hypothetical protein
VYFRAENRFFPLDFGGKESVTVPSAVTHEPPPPPARRTLTDLPGFGWWQRLQRAGA